MRLEDGRPGPKRRVAPARRPRVVSIDPAPPGYGSFEISQFSADPVECFRFAYGASELRFTSADTNISLALVGGSAFLREAIVRTAVDFSQEDTAQNIEVHVPRDNAVALLFRSYTPPSPVALTVYRIHRSGSEAVVEFVGRVISCQFGDEDATLLCAPISQVFRRKVPAVVFGSQCNWLLYGTGCGVAKASFKDSGVVSAISGADLSAAVFGSRADGWFNNGWAEVPSTLERRFIVSHVGSTITLMTPFESLVLGAAIDAYAGCERTEAICSSKFANLNRHLGFPRIPSRNPYGGGSVV